MKATVNTISTIGSAIVGLLNIIVDSCLIHGANNAKAKLLLPWIILNGIKICLGLITIVLLLISLQIVLAVINFLGFLLIAYFFIVVWSFKKELEDCDQSPKER